MTIKDIKAIEILDSRGKPTLRTFIKLDDDYMVSSAVPSGASTGKHEAVELRDGDRKRHHGQGVLKAIANVNTIIKKALVGQHVDNATDIKKIDEKIIELDGTNNKSNLGANAILSVSQAAVRAVAYSQRLPLWKFIQQAFFNKKQPKFPQIMVNVINGGKHAGWNFDIQEFMIVPTSNLPTQSVRIASEIFQQLGNELKKQKLSTLVGDEGGYSPTLTNNEQVIEAIIQAGKNYGYENGKDFSLALDSAANEFFSEGKYIFQKTNQQLTGEQLADYYFVLQKKYSIVSFEDPFAEDDWDSFRKFTNRAANQFMIVGDDIYVTNTKRIQQGIKLNATNAVLIKLNQIGTVTETIEAIKLTQSQNWKVVISHRSGETEDPFIADLAYGCGAHFIKTGSMARSERLAKYNRLIEIENGL